MSSLTSAFHLISDDRAVTAIVNHIEESLTLQTDKSRNRIHFDNAIIKNIKKIKGSHNLRYYMKVWVRKDDFEIIKNVSEYVTLMQLMESLENVNNAISILGYCIFESNYKKALCLSQSSLDVIFSPSVGE